MSKLNCGNCITGKCKQHKTSPLRTWWNRRIVRRYWQTLANIKDRTDA